MMREKPTILISINTSWNIVNFRKGLIETLKGAGYRVIAAAPEDAHSAQLASMVDHYFPLKMENAGTSPFKDMLLCLRYYQLLRKAKPDVMLAYTIKPNIYGTLAAAALGIKVINNVSGLGTAFIRTNWLTRVVCTLYRFAFCFSSRVFFQNHEDCDLFVAKMLVKREKTQILPGSGINLNHFMPPADAQIEHETPMRFILVARMLWDKGVGEYVDAARQVKQIYPDTQLSLLGPIGVENQTAIPRERIDGWIKEGLVTYLDEAADVRPHLDAHDCVVLPSYREGMSRVLLEAAAMGKPLIATDVPGCRQIVDDGVNGLLCKLQDADSLADAMRRFIEMSADARQEMGRASRRKAEAEFDEQHVFDAYLKAINALLV